MLKKVILWYNIFMHHIFIENDLIDFDKKNVVIDKNVDFNNYNHLVNSLRVKRGEEVLCSVTSKLFTYDYKTSVKDFNKDQVILFLEEETDANELPLEINLYQGMPKNDKFEFLIEKSVELGVFSIAPLILDNCVVKIDKDDKKYFAKIDRFNKISKSAAEQSRRHIIPQVLSPITLKEALEKIKDDYNIVFYENANGINETRNAIKNIKENINDANNKKINVFIGPEGGFTNREIDLMKESGFYILTLGKRILRTETAAVVALSILMYELEK